MGYVGLFFFSLLLLLSILAQQMLPTQRAKNFALLAFSLLIYFFAGAIYILLLILVTMLFWYCGLLLSEADNPGKKRALLAGPVIFSLLLLFLLKYLTPLLETTRQIFLAPQVVPQIVIPLGISVYTLNLISYLADVYREKTPAEHSFLSLLTYASLIHIAPAGPLVPYRDLRQRLAARKPHPQNFAVGVSDFSLGAVKVFLLAGGLEPLCNTLLARSDQGLMEAPVLALWLGVLLSGIRVYLLLSGYSNIAIGLGLMAGLRYPENFAYPLLSGSVKSFWEKWFMSLSVFLREYVTEPIASRGPKYKTFGTVLGYVLFGLWFGGTPNYLLLGIYLAVAICLEERLLSKLKIPVRRILGILGIFTVFYLLSFASLPRLWLGLKGLFGLSQGPLFQKAALMPALHALPLIVVSVLFCLPLSQASRSFCKTKFREHSGAQKATAVFGTLYPIGLLILTGVLLLQGSAATFLTF